jgi:acyl transferase domain-containing protein
MDPVLDRFESLVGTVRLRPPDIPLISNVTGTWITPEQATDPAYYSQHLRRTVRFAAGIGELMRTPGTILLEVGPGRTLASLVQQSQAGDAGTVVLSSMRHPQQQDDDTAVLLGALGALWTAGVPADWAGLHAGERRCRVPLPPYPFERQRYWVEPGRPAAAEERPAARAATRKQAVADWFYIPAWKQVAGSATRSRTPARDPWLVFAIPGSLGERIAQRLEQAQQEVVTIVPGSGAAWLGRQRYALDPRRRDDYGSLIEALREQGRLPRHVVHAWNVGAGTGPNPDITGFDAAQDRGFHSLLFLAQALDKSGVRDELGIAALSSGVHAVSGDEALCSERATLLGTCIVLSQEFPHLDCRNIDVIPAEPGSDAEESLIASVLGEIDSDSTEAIVAYRGGHRWVQEFRPVKLEARAGVPARLRERGVYLITGGLGSIGFALAEYLARSVRARLVLTGRSPVPDRGEWDRWLADRNEADPTSRRIRRIQSLEAQGAEVLALSADAGDLGQMQRALHQAEDRFGRIDGVIHGAGIVAEEAFLAAQDTTRSDCERHFHPKAHGLMALHAALGNRVPDFVMLLSSVSAIVGGLGYASYAAANAYMDAYAQQQARRSPGTWISVDWDAWLFAETGAGRQGMGSIVADLAMSPEAGVEAFRRILSGAPGPQVVVSTTDLATRIDQWVKRRSLAMAEPPGQEGAQAAPATEAGAAAYDTEMQAAVAGIWRQVLGVQHIEIRDNFFDLGGDSLLLMDVIARLKGCTGLVLTPREIMFQTLGQIASLCEEKRPPGAQPAGEVQEQPRKGGLFDSIKRRIRGSET